MIVEPRPLAPGRTKSSGTEPSSLPAAPGAGARPDDRTFGRTLTDVLTADRPDRTPARRAPLQRPDDDRGSRSVDRRNEGRRADDPRADGGVDADRDVTKDREAVGGERGEARESSESDRPGRADQRADSEANADEERDGAHAETVPTPLLTSLATEATDESLDVADGEGTTRALDPSVSTEPIASIVDETPIGEVTPDEPVIDGITPDNTDLVVGAAATRPEQADVDLGPTLTGTTLDDGEPGEIDTVDSGPAPDATNVPTETIERPPSIDETAVELPETEDDLESDRPAEAVTPDTRTASDNPLASVADNRPPSPSGSSGSSDDDPASPAPVSTSDGLPPSDPTATAETGADHQADGETKPEAADGPNPTEAQPAAADTAETGDQPTSLVNDQPTSALSPASSFRNPSAPTRTIATPVETAPAPELVELQNTGLAERLRPAFAAVRRGLNGLDELRLRIQDDNAGPIKVDIATVDNRVRVLLSAGNDDLMRQLGQERERLADELRRAGFDQASIDIGFGEQGRRNGRYEEDTDGRTGPGTTGRGAAGITPSGSSQPSAHPNRGLTGLDLDL